MQEIPKYVVQEKSLVGNEVHEAGAIVEYDGLPSENLKPTCPIGEARYQEYLASNSERVRKMKDQFSESAVGDPAVFMAAFLKAQKEAADEQATKQADLMASIPNMIAAAVTQALVAAFPNGTAKPAAKPAAESADPLV